MGCLIGWEWKMGFKLPFLAPQFVRDYDAAVDGKVDGNHLGLIGRQAMHGSENAFSSCHQKPHWAIQAVHPAS